jgi:hypothetical protein
MRLISALFEGYRSKRAITRNDGKALVSLIILVEAATLESSYIISSKVGQKEGLKLVLGHIDAAKWLIRNRTKVENTIVGWT